MIKDKITKELIKGIKVKAVFFINSKKKTTFNLVSDSKGKCAFFTNKYRVGSHKLVVYLKIPTVYKKAIDSRYKAIKKTTTYSLKKSQKFLVKGKYFNIVYSSGSVKIS